jgi:hypothetical protein
LPEPVNGKRAADLFPWLVKVNALGYESWNSPYTQVPRESFAAVVQTDDEGYVIAMGQQATLVRIDSSGSELWRLALDRGEGYQTTCLARTEDGGYVVAGTTSQGFDAGFLIKVAAEPDSQSPVVIIMNPQSETYETGDIPLVFTVNKPVFEYRLLP